MSTPKPERTPEQAPREPTQFELAIMSIGLAVVDALAGRDRPAAKKTTEALPADALALWDACGATLAARKPTLTQQALAAIERELASLPPPSRFPVPFKEFLRLLIGGDSVADREKSFRDYCRDELRRKRALAQNVEPHLEPLPEAFDPEVEERWANWKTHGISKGEYIDVFRRFKLWREQRQAMAARRATAKRWPQPAAD